MKDKVILEETYNTQGVCIKRTANGKELPSDTKPSILILEDYGQKWFKQRKVLSTEEYNNLIKTK